MGDIAPQNSFDRVIEIVYFYSSLGRLRSGQTQQTVNLSADAFGGSNPSLPTDGQLKSLFLSTGIFFN